MTQRARCTGGTLTVMQHCPLSWLNDSVICITIL